LQDALRYVEWIIADRALPLFADEIAGYGRDESRRVLQRLADLSLRYLHAQLFVVQASTLYQERLRLVRQ
jgi:hypothetical protein